MPTENPSPRATASTVLWAGRCDAHARSVEMELASWGHRFPDGPPDAEDALILLRRTVGEVRAAGPGLPARTADLLERATVPLEAARLLTARTLTPAVLPLVSHHLRVAAAALAAARAHLAAAGAVPSASAG
ncbi:hypothetical protein [Kitasatospora sp. NPDC050463]|uniref:hypothetical protein n=1 Tax=Kitasatospora sp. NPDC050463 TaxID=3155786 RepID=UPI0033DBC303